MTLNDGATDEKPHPHALKFRGVEPLEESLGCLGIEADFGILHEEANVVIEVAGGPDD